MSGILNEQDYNLLQQADEMFNGEIHKLLNRNGCANWTVCPVCRVDDFIHVEGCRLIPNQVISTTPTQVG